MKWGTYLLLSTVGVDIEWGSSVVADAVRQSAYNLTISVGKWGNPREFFPTVTSWATIITDFLRRTLASSALAYVNVLL